AALVVPAGVVGPAERQLGDQHRGAPLGEEEERETGGDDGVVVEGGLAAVAAPGSVGLLGIDEEVAADLVPVVPAEVAVAGERAGALDAVQAVERRGEALDGVLLGEPGGEAGAEPVQGAVDRLVLDVHAAILGAAVLAEDGLAGGEVE